jgi:hypothetical protein
MERSLRKSFCHLDVHIGISKFSAHKATKLLKLCPYKIKAAQHFPLKYEARNQYYRWFQDLVANGFLTEVYIIFT